MAQSFLLSKEFWLAAAERAIKTGAQAGLASGILDAVKIWEIDWQQFVSIVVLAMIFSVLTSIASGKIGDQGQPSLGPEQLKGEPNGNGEGGDEFDGNIAPLGKHGVKEIGDNPLPVEDFREYPDN